MKIQVTLLLSSILILPQIGFAELKSAESLSGLMGAVSKVIGEKTKIAGVDEAPPKLSPPAEQAYKALESELENCQTSKTTEPQLVTVEKDGVSVKFKKFDLKIYGDKCPLELSANLTSTDETQEKLAATFRMKVVFKQQSYIEKYKLRFVEISGALSALANKKGEAIQVPVHLELSGKGDSVDLGLFSQSTNFNLLLEANLAQFSFNVLTEQTATLKYQDISKKAYSKVKMTGFNQPEILYTIDEKQVSESEFQAFMQTFVMPGMVADEDPNAPDSKAPTSCIFVAYDKKSISTEALKAQLQTSKLQAAGQLVRGESCMKDVKIPFKKDSQTFEGSLSFGEEWISFASSPKSSVYVLYGDAIPQTSESEEMILGLQCKPTPTCQ